MAVITDALQALLMLAGSWIVITVVTYQMGGVGWLPTSWQPQWDEQATVQLRPVGTEDRPRSHSLLDRTIGLRFRQQPDDDSAIHGSHGRQGC